MTEKILEKFDALEEKERILAAIREKNTNRRERKKPLITPLLFDLHAEFGDTITPSASKTVAKIIEDKPHDLKNSKKPVKEHKEENRKSGRISLRYLKDKDETEYAKPLPFPPPGSKHRFSPSFTGQNESRTKKSSKVRRKYPPEVNKFITKDSELTRNDQARKPDPVKQNIVLPLDCQDLLKDPKIKTIDPAPKGTVHTSMEQCHTSPIIFYDTEYVQMLFLTKRFTPYAMKCTEKNIVLEKNYEVFKALFDDETSTVFKPQSTNAIEQQKQLGIFSAKQAHEDIKEKRKKKHDSLVSKKTSPNTLYNLSQTFSSLSKKFVGYFDKDVTQEKSEQADQFEMFSKTKPPPTRKFTTLPIKYDSKPLKNIIEIRKLNNITPLDNLLGLNV
ncbi:Uncharacterized protein C1orf141 homolog [Apodemus speciosus]|uniref:Uncharacterized protein C1orf141 homolog n=1 Tax=Apodemus speciosus TaxID=105296 RepID=A0ABQ0ENQ5_APOSI